MEVVAMLGVSNPVSACSSALVPGSDVCVDVPLGSFIARWDVLRGKRVASFQPASQNMVTCLQRTADRQLAVTACSGGELALWDASWTLLAAIQRPIIGPEHRMPLNLGVCGNGIQDGRLFFAVRSKDGNGAIFCYRSDVPTTRVAEPSPSRYDLLKLERGHDLAELLKAERHSIHHTANTPGSIQCVWSCNDSFKFCDWTDPRACVFVSETAHDSRTFDSSLHLVASASLTSDTVSFKHVSHVDLPGVGVTAIAVTSAGYVAASTTARSIHVYALCKDATGLDVAFAGHIATFPIRCSRQLRAVLWAPPGWTPPHPSPAVQPDPASPAPGSRHRRSSSGNGGGGGGRRRERGLPLLLCSGSEESLDIWRVSVSRASASLVHTATAPTGELRQFLWTSAGNLVVCNEVALWHVDLTHTVPRHTTIEHHHIAISCGAWRGDGHAIASADLAGVICAWKHDPTQMQLGRDAAQNEHPWLRVATPTMMRRLIWSPSGKHLLAGSMDGDLYVIPAVEPANAGTAPPADAAALSAPAVIGSFGSTITCLSWRPVASSSSSSSPPCYDLALSTASGMLVLLPRVTFTATSATHEEAVVLRAHTPEVWSVAWSPDGLEIATASEDHTTRVWHAPLPGDSKLRPVAAYPQLSGHAMAVTCVDWRVTSRGSLLVSSSDDLTVRVWHMVPGTSAQLLHVLTTRDRYVAYVALDPTPTHCRVACGTAYGAMYIWNLATPSQQQQTVPPTARFMLHAGSIEGVEWNSAVDRVLACSSRCSIAVIKPHRV